MTVKNNHQQFLDFRQDYPFFEYQSYSFYLKDETLNIEYCFNLANKVVFKPNIKIPIKHFFDKGNLSDDNLKNFVFHIGMIELISYWKATCPAMVIVKPHKLDEKQILWWKKLYFNGLGEFFYLNGINTDKVSFMSIYSRGETLSISNSRIDGDKVLVPIGGGKDSVVTLELLKNSGTNVIPIVVNPRKASIRTIETAGFNQAGALVVNRNIDKELLELNSRGFLNGHTPFSALLAFAGVLCCSISGSLNIALSNESSANESTVPNSKINHQYSKSFEFEEDFNWYLKNYIHPNINYFSFLRPINELQIAKLFSGFPQHFDGFRSCNVGSKNDTWCSSCPKCLFTYIILSPFVKEEKLINIFGKDMLDDTSLINIFNELTGVAEVKPFECVGTISEVVAALAAFSNYKQVTKKLLNNVEFIKNDSEFEQLISEYNTELLLPHKFENILKTALND